MRLICTAHFLGSFLQAAAELTPEPVAEPSMVAAINTVTKDLTIVVTDPKKHCGFALELFYPVVILMFFLPT
jgi:hypothetical protein